MVASIGRRLWDLLPLVVRTVLLLAALVLASAAAVAPVVYLLRRVGVG